MAGDLRGFVLDLHCTHCWVFFLFCKVLASIMHFKSFVALCLIGQVMAQATTDAPGSETDKLPPSPTGSICQPHGDHCKSTRPCDILDHGTKQMQGTVSLRPPWRQLSPTRRPRHHARLMATTGTARLACPSPRLPRLRRKLVHRPRRLMVTMTTTTITMRTMVTETARSALLTTTTGIARLASRRLPIPLLRPPPRLPRPRRPPTTPVPALEPPEPPLSLLVPAVPTSSLELRPLPASSCWLQPWPKAQVYHARGRC